MKLKLTDTLIKSLPAPLAGVSIVWDTILPQFGIKISKTGSKVFVHDYRYDRVQRRYTIGDFPVWSVNAARDRVKELMREIDKGNDPLGIKQAKKAAPTMAELWDLYEVQHFPMLAPTTLVDQKSMLRKYLRPYFSKQKVDSVGYSDIKQFHLDVSKHHLYRANRLVEVLGVAFNLAIRHDWIVKNPTTGIKANKEQPRELFLTPDEVRRIISALDNSTDYKSACIIKLLIMTGARKGEVLKAEWKDFDLANGVWIKPYEKNKQRREHRVPLSSEVVSTLKRLKLNSSADYVFPGKGGDSHQVEFKHFWKAILREAKIRKVRIHDLRHSFASLSVSEGVDLYRLSKLMGHSSIATTQRYAKLYDSPLREATELVSNVIMRKDKQNGQ